jgi:enterochelin esterase-like enzyme
MDSLPQHAVARIPYPQFNNFDLFDLQLTSSVLKNNPLGDSYRRHCPVLSPKGVDSEQLGLVFVLSGFAGNGTKYLADKGFDQTFMQQLDQLVENQSAPKAHYLFVDAWTFWGGSQFINSPQTGRYEDYLLEELYPLAFKTLNIKSNQVAVVGHSSGGYGALHLASKYPEHFPYCAATAPDCFFETSLLPDLYKAAPFLLQNKSYLALKQLHRDRQILKQKNGFSIVNAIAMTACYSPKSKTKNLQWPIDFATGRRNENIWKQWQSHDPVVFLPKRVRQLKKLKGLYLEVGHRDEFNLQFGVRQIHHHLKKAKVRHHYSEFSGGHFDNLERNPYLWQWLQNQWKKN